MIILEEDLDVSVDIFGYFSQLLPLMDQDESLYCVSAWNDQVECENYCYGDKMGQGEPSVIKCDILRVETCLGCFSEDGSVIHHCYYCILGLRSYMQ